MSFTCRYAPFGKKNGYPSSGLSCLTASQRPSTPAVKVAPDALGRSSVCGSAPGSAPPVVVVVVVVVAAGAVVVGVPAATVVLAAAVVVGGSTSTNVVRRSTR